MDLVLYENDTEVGRFELTEEKSEDSKYLTVIKDDKTYYARLDTDKTDSQKQIKIGNLYLQTDAIGSKIVVLILASMNKNTQIKINPKKEYIIIGQTYRKTTSDLDTKTFTTHELGLFRYYGFHLIAYTNSNATQIIYSKSLESTRTKLGVTKQFWSVDANSLGNIQSVEDVKKIYKMTTGGNKVSEMWIDASTGYILNMEETHKWMTAKDIEPMTIADFDPSKYELSGTLLNGSYTPKFNFTRGAITSNNKSLRFPLNMNDDTKLHCEILTEGSHRAQINILDSVERYPIDTTDIAGTIASMAKEELKEDNLQYLSKVLKIVATSQYLNSDSNYRKIIEDELRTYLQLDMNTGIDRNKMIINNSTVEALKNSLENYAVEEYDKVTVNIHTENPDTVVTYYELPGFEYGSDVSKFNEYDIFNLSLE